MKKMDLPLWKNSHFAFFIKLCSSCLWRLLLYLEHQQTLFLDLFLTKMKEKKKLTFWPTHGLSPLKKCQGFLFFKSMFLLPRQACFLTKTSPNTSSRDCGREVWERVLSGNLDKNPKWPIRGNKQHQALDNTYDRHLVVRCLKYRWGKNFMQEPIVIIFDLFER